MKLLIASPTQGSIRSMAALPKMGAIPQQSIVAKAKTRGEVFTASLLFSGNEFPLFTPYLRNPEGRRKGLFYCTWFSPSFRVIQTKERFAMKHRIKTLSLAQAVQWISGGGGIERILSRFFGFEKVFIRLDDQVVFSFGIGRITG